MVTYRLYHERKDRNAESYYVKCIENENRGGYGKES
jgi:hypothetical protein